jgi:phenylpropionate dioxygenase-like ring-hydroxylating dioxygenase large terminal subunit
MRDMDAELEPLLPPPQNDPKEQLEDPLVGYREWNIRANWQLLVETFLESYHVSTLHRDTSGLVAHSNVMVTDVLDERSLRMTVPLKNFSATSVPNDDSFFGQTTTTYFVFPNSAIRFFKRFALFLSIVPTGDSESRIRSWGLGYGAVENRDLQRRDLSSVLAGIEEDWQCSEDIQCGLDAAYSRVPRDAQETSPAFTYGRFEGCNVLFLHNVGAAAAAMKNQDT